MSATLTASARKSYPQVLSPHNSRKIVALIRATVPPQTQPAKRLAYLDWMRGLACLLMFQAHCYSSWLTLDKQKTEFFRWAQLGGTLPAPLFLFLTGISSALVSEKLRAKGFTSAAIAKTALVRGAQIYALGIFFRLQEFVVGYPKSPWTDLLRVDILNILGLALMFMGVLRWLTSAPEGSDPIAIEKSRNRAIVVSLAAAALISLVTPLLWTTSAFHRLPWPVESYINGVHNFQQPQVWLFPIFPWMAFAFVGLSVGLFLFSGDARKKEISAFAGLGAIGAAVCLLSLLFDGAPLRLYPSAIYDYWHTSPNFFLMRCGILLILLSLTYAWCRWGFAQKGFSPVIQLGTTSLLVYWVHIEFVFGRLSILPKGQCAILKSTGGLLLICAAMLAISLLRTKWKNRSVSVLRPSPAPAAAIPES
ncbi:MAG TPA: heparan-alpha-glucosaminide N-acetyltransferase domain-containing protein [Candidatus Acidoferrum sp.]|jgi:uncharacterized membrane protein